MDMQQRSSLWGRRFHRLIWPVLRQVLGWFFIVLGLLGIVLPILQGVLFLVIGVALVGRRNWLIRRSTLVLKRWLRRWARHPNRWLAWPGRWALQAQYEGSRQSRRLHRHFAERARQRTLRDEPVQLPPLELP